MSSDVFSSSSYSIGTTGGFESITTLFAMIKSSLVSTKTKGVVEIIWYLHSKGFNAFI
jgi:hypothetical protein